MGSDSIPETSVAVEIGTSKSEIAVIALCPICALLAVINRRLQTFTGT
jgi:hypothetical protein